MADETGTKGGSGLTTTASAGAQLKSDGGMTHISDAVVTKVAGIAAREVGGVYELGGGAARRIGSVTQAVGFGDERMQGVSVEVGEKQTAVDLVVVMEYGESIPRVSEAIRDNVKKRIEGITGLEVTEVNISVNDLHFAGDDQAVEAEPRVE